MVISLYYKEELTMKEIAAVLQSGESRVCQIHGTRNYQDCAPRCGVALFDENQIV